MYVDAKAVLNWREDPYNSNIPAQDHCADGTLGENLTNIHMHQRITFLSPGREKKTWRLEPAFTCMRTQPPNRHSRGPEDHVFFCRTGEKNVTTWRHQQFKSTFRCIKGSRLKTAKITIQWGPCKFGSQWSRWDSNTLLMAVIVLDLKVHGAHFNSNCMSKTILELRITSILYIQHPDMWQLHFRTKNVCSSLQIHSRMWTSYWLSIFSPG
jgi:hypothetical protein